MANRIPTIIVGALLMAGLPHASAQVPKVSEQTSKDIQAAIATAGKGLTEQAVQNFESAAERASGRGDNAGAAEARYFAARLLVDLGQRDKANAMLFQAAEDAKGTDVEVQMQAALGLGSAQALLDKDDFLKCLEALFNFLDLLQESASGPREMWRSVKSGWLTTGVNLFIRFAEKNADTLQDKGAGELPIPIQNFLLSAVTATRPEPQGVILDQYTPNQKPLSAEQLDLLDKARPWKEKLLGAAFEFNQRVTSLDKELPGLLGEIEVARDMDQQAEIYRLLGDVEKAIEIKKAVLAVFDKANLFLDSVIALDGLCQLYVEQRNGKAWLAALAASEDLIFRVERQSYETVGETIGEFLDQFKYAYVRHYYLLLDGYRVAKMNGSPDPRKLWFVIRQADRMNFRPVRRDLGVYHELEKQIAASPDLLRAIEQQQKVLLERQKARDLASDEGKTADDFRSEAPEGLSYPEGGYLEDITSPFFALAKAKREFVSIMAGPKRQHVGSSGTVATMPDSVEEVRRGMTADDVIVMYFRQPPRPKALYLIDKRPANASQLPTILNAAVITDRELRLVELNLDVKRVGELVRNVRNLITISSAGAAGALKDLSAAIWSPIGHLPKNVTVVLTPDLIGVPFEVLPDVDEQPLVAQHNIRYSFGLGAGIGAKWPLHDHRSAFVAGADRFPQRHLASLPSSKEEIDALRDFFQRRNVLVSPTYALPDTGRPIFTGPGTFNILHLSTHSLLDPEIPLLDTLVFPHDEIAAYDLALTPFRSDLVVLSACELFRARRDPMNPVSGVTTATLARISPQVLSTLWTVSDTAASRVFMLRFYDALLTENDPSASLAIAKRDFVNPSQLRFWMKSAGIAAPEGVDIESYREAYIWAPFVLVIGFPIGSH